MAETIKARLRENAPYPTQKLRGGIILNKVDFVEIVDPLTIEQVRFSLSRVVEIEGEKPKRVLKETIIEPTNINNTIILDSDNRIEPKDIKAMLDNDDTKGLSKTEIKEFLIKELNFSELDLKGLTKKKLIDIYKIDRL